MKHRHKSCLPYRNSVELLLSLRQPRRNGFHLRLRKRRQVSRPCHAPAKLHQLHIELILLAIAMAFRATLALPVLLLAFRALLVLDLERHLEAGPLDSRHVRAALNVGVHAAVLGLLVALAQHLVQDKLTDCRCKEGRPGNKEGGVENKTGEREWWRRRQVNEGERGAVASGD